MARNTGGVSYKQGVVHESRPGFARVRFDDLDGLVSDWLPVAAMKSLKDKQGHTLDTDEHVACLLDEHFEDGVVLGAVYSDADTPPTDSGDVLCWSWFDGGVMSYDRSSGLFSLQAMGNVAIEAGGSITLKSPQKVTIDAPEAECTGNLLVKGGLTYQGGMAGSGGSGGGASARITGGMDVDGNITATGTIMDSGGNSNHHSHD